MPRGGKRPGAGRKPGRLNKRTVARQQLASTAAGQGITPLEVILKRMRYYDSGSCPLRPESGPEAGRDR
jgi:hypothetical protein